jgi:hypothetical protein
LLDPGKISLYNKHKWGNLADEAVSQARNILKEEWDVTKNPLKRIFRS